MLNPGAHAMGRKTTNSLRAWKVGSTILLFCTVVTISASAQTFTNLATFDITNGAFPSGLVQGLDGNFYGTTSGGGKGGVGGPGTVFSVTSAGVISAIHKFQSGTDGAQPLAGFVLAADGNFYGTTNGNSTTGRPTIFKVAPDGTLTTLNDDFGLPLPLIQNNVNGTFYGIMPPGGLRGGTVLAITSAGAVSTLYTFCKLNGCPDGNNPQAGLVQAPNGIMYGTTADGGKGYTDPKCVNNPGIGCGVVFAIGTGGIEKTLHSFNWTDGAQPETSLVLGSDGNLYGTTQFGPVTTPSCNPCGTIFKITTAGVLTTLYSDSRAPSALIQGTDGNFYGTTPGTTAGGSCSNTACGSVFQITPGGTYTTLHTFDKTDGLNPISGLVQGTDGNFYGTTNGFVGQHVYGTVFQLSMGLAPFVKTVPTAAYPGTNIFILGTNLTGATSVTFNGTSAVFTVESAREIIATVPNGSTTGTVQVVTPSGTLSSNASFKVF